MKTKRSFFQQKSAISRMLFQRERGVSAMKDAKFVDPVRQVTQALSRLGASRLSELSAVLHIDETELQPIIDTLAKRGLVKIMPQGREEEKVLVAQRQLFVTR